MIDGLGFIREYKKLALTVLETKRTCVCKICKLCKLANKGGAIEFHGTNFVNEKHKYIRKGIPLDWMYSHQLKAIKILE